MPTPPPCVHLNKIKYSLNVNGPVYLYEDVELLIESEAQKMLSIPFKCCFSYILSIYICVYTHTLQLIKVTKKDQPEGFWLPKCKYSSHELKISAIPERKHFTDPIVNTISD